MYNKNLNKKIKKIVKFLPMSIVINYSKLLLIIILFIIILLIGIAFFFSFFVSWWIYDLIRPLSGPTSSATTVYVATNSSPAKLCNAKPFPAKGREAENEVASSGYCGKISDETTEPCPPGNGTIFIVPNCVEI